MQNAVCWLLASLRRVSTCIECWSRPQIQCRILLPYWVCVESFQLTESGLNHYSLRSQPHLILDALFLRTFYTWSFYRHESQPHLLLDSLSLRTFCTWSLYGHKSQTLANILFAGSAVRLGLVFKYKYKSTFLQQVGWERCLVVLKGTLKSVDLPRLERRLDCGSLCRASASNLGTDICMIRLLSVFSLLSFLSFSGFDFSCYVGQCLTLASSVHCQDVMNSVGLLCNILWWVGQYHKC